jgi:hypothetical protein
VVASARAVERLVGSDELQAAIRDIPDLTAQFGRTLTEVGSLTARLGESIDPSQSRLEVTIDEASLTFQATRDAIADARGAFTTDTGVGYDLAQALIGLREAADALRTLAISLERNPDMLLRGPGPPQR